MRTVYLGTSDFAAGVLRRIAQTPHRPALVVTRPDRPAGRGRKLSPPPVAMLAGELGIALAQPEDVNGEEARAQIAAQAPERLLLCAYGALIKGPLLAEHEILNVHPSLLPRWRGAAPVERAIMAGDEQTGVTIMCLTEGLDSGPVCLQEVTPIGAEEDYGALAARLEEVGARLLVRALDEQPPFTEQDEAGVTYAEKITAADRTINPSAPEQAVRVVRALSPHIGARLALDDGSYLGVRAARVGEDGALELLEVQPAGGHPMSYADYVRGHARA